ncbi:hypothetical protein ROZALSC1DRAFT_25415 [Rozella allomycis CSF55]|uniref:Uncharacterized protein n=1 Tax=Rozella allomycis (strain CSF55) TaxID=988480 RepID=A0A4P9YAU0_ROZAC|nr:hypothetical protein ROZALSC1DRAFT_25415 [Rozella allomycis CSF55]
MAILADSWVKVADFPLLGLNSIMSFQPSVVDFSANNSWFVGEAVRSAYDYLLDEMILDKFIDLGRTRMPCEQDIVWDEIMVRIERKKADKRSAERETAVA